jgi:hypothetical protein
MNNFLPNRPPLMSDGRNFSSWQPDAAVNKRIQENAAITSNWQYRQYMQQNGMNIMKFNSLQAEHDSGLDVSLKFDNSKSSNPYVYKSVFDSSKPYQMSDLKAPYMSREQLNARMVAPTIQPNQQDR